MTNPRNDDSSATSGFVLPLNPSERAVERPLSPSAREPRRGQTPDDSLSALPKAVRTPGNLMVQREPVLRGGELLRRQAQALRQAGARLDTVTQCTGLFLAELREGLGELEALGDRPESRRDCLRRLHEILDWCQAAHADVRAESRRAAGGEQLVDLLVLSQDVLHDAGGSTEERPIEISGTSARCVWGQVDAMATAVRLAIDLVVARTAATGIVRVEVGDDEAGPFVRVLGVAGPAGQPSGALVDDFRQAAREAGFRVAPDEFGPGGSGIVLRPAPDRLGPLA